MELNDIFTQEQVDSIRRIIVHQCQRHRQREVNYQDLYYAPYAGNRGEHSITLSILSGFQENTQIQGLTITTEKYGLHDKMGQPILANQNVVAHILNSGCGFSSKPFKDNCRMYNSDLHTQPVYVCVVFTASNDGVLKNISIKVPDSSGNFQEEFEFEIFNYSAINANIA